MALCTIFQGKNFTKTSQKLHNFIFAHSIDDFHFDVLDNFSIFVLENNKQWEYYETTFFYLSSADLLPGMCTLTS